MKSRILSPLLILLFITACNGTIDVGIEHSSTGTATPNPTVIDTLSPANTVLPTVTQSASAATHPYPLPPWSSAIPLSLHPQLRRRPTRVWRIILMTAAHPHR